MTNHESYQKQIEERITKTPCPLPHYPLHDGLLLDLRQYPKIASLKHSQPGLDFFEEAYLSTCPYQFAKVSLDNLENVLNYLKAELEWHPTLLFLILQLQLDLLLFQDSFGKFLHP